MWHVDLFRALSRTRTIEEAGPPRKRSWYTVAMHHVLRAPALTAQGFSHGFSLRQGGVSEPPFDSLNLATQVGDDPAHVAENQRRFAAWVGYDAAQLYTVSQVHGRQVERVTGAQPPDVVRSWQADALVAGAGAAVGVRTADCVPLLLGDPITRRVAAVHAGWRGVVAGVVPAAVAALCELSGSPVPPSRLSAALFPHIRRCCFEVGEDVAQALSALQLDAGQTVFASKTTKQKPRVALDSLVRAQLMAAGLPPEHIEDVPGCTCCEPARFFSFRRDGAASGRHLSVIVG
jgi:YfiH family protein